MNTFDSVLASAHAWNAENGFVQRKTPVETVTYQEECRPTPIRDTTKPSLPDALEMVADNFFKNEFFALQVIERLGGFTAISKRKPKPKPLALPMDRVWAAEMSIGTGKPKPETTATAEPKPKTSNAYYRQKIKYSITLQCWFGEGNGDFSDPDWHGVAKLRTPDRALHDLDKKTASKAESVPSHSDAQRQWMTDTVIPFARENDMLIGWLMSKASGTEWYDCHCVLVPAELVEEDRTSQRRAVILQPNATIILPSFLNKTSTGKVMPVNPKKSTYFLQTRACADERVMKGWNAGPLERF